MGQRLIISENEKNQISKIYGLNEQLNPSDEVQSKGEKIGFLSDSELKGLIETLAKCVMDEDGLNKMKRLSRDQKADFVEMLEAELGIYIDRDGRPGSLG